VSVALVVGLLALVPGPARADRCWWSFFDCMDRVEEEYMECLEEAERFWDFFECENDFDTGIFLCHVEYWLCLGDYIL
jgi:hypothetical protein